MPMLLKALTEHTDSSVSIVMLSEYVRNLWALSLIRRTSQELFLNNAKTITTNEAKEQVSHTNRLTYSPNSTFDLFQATPLIKGAQ